MLADAQIITPIAVHDIENAVDFYGNVLGLKQVAQKSGRITFESVGGRIGIHQSPTAGSSQATSVWWTVDDVEATVAALKKRGISFETNYDLPHTKRKGDIYILSESERGAWFKDPDGNILGIGNF